MLKIKEQIYNCVKYFETKQRSYFFRLMNCLELKTNNKSQSKLHFKF